MRIYHLLLLFVGLLISLSAALDNKNLKSHTITFPVSYSNNSVIVYSGQGTHNHTVKNTVLSLKNGFPHLQVFTLDLEQITTHNISSALLLVMPSGPKKEFSEVAPTLVPILVSYIRGGGKYIGVNSGAAIFCQTLDFNDELINPPVAIYNGTCKGPIAPHNINDMSGSRAVQVELIGEGAPQFPSFYSHGSSYFLDLESSTNCSPLANFMLPEKVSEPHLIFSKEGSKYPIIMKCSFGKGLAILTFLHIENNKFFLTKQTKKHPSDKHLKKVTECLSDMSTHTKSLYFLFSQIGISKSASGKK
ncbi:uncharacterized protein CMU_015670 [Cryptosporidium muris RN66]|uniref:Biotin-protein ligase N-terminal domain-containing protein n=1 Tax=Cryptosporidium muris (strain RN66) TaxID=441375 RepID=B6ACG6_CRYMR|nr:uncharacterized protein CMU_015670 [Cryptosporidium muris RN66]EEA05820.1 hypothetical protein CMU_015670 [Cryptosporidium muris RN66]|eukprot:XP_002140169.1 hypothetical protein [Cryptosporidium muris RN66]